MRRVDRVLSACLVASGAAGLIYEVLWLRQLALVMGNTVYALSAVLTAFLGGLALGAFLGGRWTERYGASLRLYVAIELCIAGSALLMPWLIRSLGPVFGLAYRGLGDAFVTYNLVQFALCGLLLLVPTSFMGATLPVVTAVLVRDKRDIAIDVGRLYALNSMGGVVGAGVAGFALLPWLGMLGTGLAAVAINAAVAAAANWLPRSESPLHTGSAGKRRSALRDGPEKSFETTRKDRVSSGRTEKGFENKPIPPPYQGGGKGEVFESRGVQSEAAGWAPPPPALLVLLYGLSGFAALTLEVGWARIVSLSIGSTTYGSTMILVTYICGLAAGSYAVPRVRAIARNPVVVVFGLHAIIAVSSLLSLAYLGSLPIWVAQLVGGGRLGFRALIGVELLLVFATIAVPTLAMGGLFPLVSQLLQQSVAASGRAVGSTYAANTLGNIAGSFAAGFVFVPAIGMRATIVVSAAMSGAVGLCYALPAMRAKRWPALLSSGALVGVLALAAAGAPAWDREIVTSAPYLYGSTIFRGAGQDAAAIKDAIRKKFGDLIDYREGASTVVAVKRLRDTLMLQVGGTGLSEALSQASTQNFIAHLPLLLHGRAKNVLVIGLGSGTTLGSVLKHPVESAECVEISPEVRDVARQHFSEYTGHALDDPRARVIIGDGRNHLRHTGKLYDVIISQPSHPWVSGAASLFTREYFADVRDHLAPGGVACAWFAPYNEVSKRSVLRAWSDVFPDAYVFESDGLVLIGRRDRGPLAAANVAAGMAHPAVQRDLGRLGITEPADLLGSLVLGPEALARFVGDTPVNTDDRAYVEFRGLQDAHQYNPIQVLAGFGIYRQDPARLVDAKLPAPQETAAFAHRLAALFESKTLALKAKQLEAEEGQSPLWRALLQTAAALDPKRPQTAAASDKAGGDPSVLAKTYTNLGGAYEQQGLLDDAEEALKKAVSIEPDLAEAHHNLANVSYKKGLAEDAIAQYEEALRINPKLASANYNLGVIYYQRHDYERAIYHIDRAVADGFAVPPRSLELLKPYRK